MRSISQNRTFHVESFIASRKSVSHTRHATNRYNSTAEFIRCDVVQWIWIVQFRSMVDWIISRLLSFSIPTMGRFFVGSTLLRSYLLLLLCMPATRPPLWTNWKNAFSRLDLVRTHFGWTKNWQIVLLLDFCFAENRPKLWNKYLLTRPIHAQSNRHGVANAKRYAYDSPSDSINRLILNESVGTEIERYLCVFRISLPRRYTNCAVPYVQRQRDKC